MALCSEFFNRYNKSMTHLKINLLYLLPILIFLNLTVLTTSDKSFNEDLGRHLKIGEIISSEKQVIKTNLFSHTLPDQPFVDHHWLSQVIFWQIFKNFGTFGLFVFKLSLLNLTIGLFFFSLLNKRKSFPFLALPLLALSLIILKIRIDLRPELFSYLFISLFLVILKKPLTLKRSLVLVFLQILWVNLHIYFFLGPLLVLTSRIKHLSKPFLFRLSLITLANLINPYFLLGALSPFLIFTNYGYSVVENQSLFFMESYFKTNLFFIYKALTFLVGLSLLYSVKRKDVPGSILQSLALIFSLIMVRNFPLLPLLSLGPLLQNSNLLLKKITPKTKAFSLNLGFLSGLCFLMIALGSFLIPQKATIKRPHFYTKYAALTKFLKASQPQNHIFNNYDPGSWLIFKFYPEYPVFVDNRPEAYNSEFFQKIYIPMQENKQVFEKYEQIYGLKTIIWSKTDLAAWSKTFLTKVLPELDSWQKIYEDEVSLVYQKID